MPGLLQTGDFRGVDLNLLRVFDAIAREGSVTGAGAALGQSQSAVSHALARLRVQLGDPLFVRTTTGMRATPFADRLAVATMGAFQALSDGVGSAEPFVPLTSRRCFTLLTTDMAELLLFPALVGRLRRAAPYVRITSRQAARVAYRAELEAGTADLAIGKLPDNHVDFQHQRLFEGPVVCVFRQDHPLIGDTLSLDQFLEIPQVTISEPAQADTLVARALGPRAAQRRVVLQLSHYLAVPGILRTSDLIAAMPVMGDSGWLAEHGLRILPLPFRVPPFRIVQYWHAHWSQDEGHRWLRGEVAKLFMGKPATLHASWHDAAEPAPAVTLAREQRPRSPAADRSTAARAEISASRPVD